MTMRKSVRTLLAGAMFLLGAAASHAWAGDAVDGGGTILYVSMSVVGRGGYGDSCGSLDDSTITANIGDHVHICYTGQNNTSTTLGIQSISNSIDGDLFTDFALDIQPGGQQLLADFRVTITGTMDVTHTWIARESEGQPAADGDGHDAYRSDGADRCADSARHRRNGRSRRDYTADIDDHQRRQRRSRLAFRRSVGAGRSARIADVEGACRARCDAAADRRNTFGHFARTSVCRRGFARRQSVRVA